MDVPTSAVSPGQLNTTHSRGNDGESARVIADAGKEGANPCLLNLCQVEPLQCFPASRDDDALTAKSEARYQKENSISNSYPSTK